MGILKNALGLLTNDPETLVKCAKFVEKTAEGAVNMAGHAVESVTDYIESIDYKQSHSRQEKICFSFDDVENGDVIRVSRQGGLYDHYGIYVKENNHVIHYTGANGPEDFNGVVLETDFGRFLNGAAYFVVCRFPEHISSLDELSSYEHPLKTAGKMFNGEMMIEPVKNIKNTAGALCKIFGETSTSARVLKAERDSESEKRIRGYHLYSGEETVARARAMIGENIYDIACNNCEHFAIYCKTGLRESSQVNCIINSIESLGIPLRSML